MAASVVHRPSNGDVSAILKSASEAELPYIPGMRRHPALAKRVSQKLKIVHGIRREDNEMEPLTFTKTFTDEEEAQALEHLGIFRNTAHVRQANRYTDLKGRYSLTNQAQDKINKVHNLPFGPEPQRLPRFIEFDRKALKYHAWYKEDVPESPLETDRVRRCDLYYYLEDKKIQIVEHRQANSGIPQGDLLKRLLVPKPDKSGFLTDRDLYIGAQVEIFGKVFTIVDANESTKHHMASLGLEVADPLPYPFDAYTQYITAKMQRETGADITVPRNRRMHPMKEYMESILGKPVKIQDLGRFLEHDKKVLRFFAMWDDTSSLYGDQLLFKIHYYLVDDTMEVVPEWDRNSGRDRVGKLLSRSKIVKVPAVKGGKEQYYQWKDLVIGSEVKVFGRTLKVIGADPFTRQYFVENAEPLGEDIIVPEPPVPKYSRPIPPHTGYGSEEDTLKNCFSFDPRPPLKDGAKAILNSGKILRYGARVLTNYKDDKMRYFVIMYFLEDDTIAIREPPIRNSGFTGGNFLSRTKIMKNVEERFEPYDLYVGALVQMQAHKFELISADDYTLQYMESRSHEGWSKSSIYKILDKLRPYAQQLRTIIVRLNHPTGRLSYQNIKDAVRATGVQLEKQEEITLIRALDPLKKGEIPSYRLIKRVEGTAL